jgi:pyruvate formate lyase activating enzyme
MLEKLLEKKLIDYIAMDLKAPAEKYNEITGIAGNFNNIKKSVKLIMQSGLPYEFRTTVVPNLLNKDDINEMGKIIQDARAWYLQGFKSSEDLINQDLQGKVPYNSRQMKEMAEVGSKYVKKCEVR